MIIARLQNGLGNQMFQYAAGLALARHHKTQLKLDISWYSSDSKKETHEVYGLGLFGIPEKFAASEDLRFKKGLAALWPFNSSLLYFQEPEGLNDKTFFSLPNNCYINGYFQSDQFFRPISDTIRSLFSIRQAPSKKVAQVANQIATATCPIALHVRRGDYLNNPALKAEFGPLSWDYYARAISFLKKTLGPITVFVFSDDIETVEAEFLPDAPCVYVSATEHKDFYEKLRLMSLCRHAIISNSSFAWWGAWLIPGKDKLVLAPDPWFVGTRFDRTQIVPPHWVRFPRNPRQPSKAVTETQISF